MLYNERGERHGQALDIAKKMMVAARTAPKGKGIDAIEVAGRRSADRRAGR